MAPLHRNGPTTGGVVVDDGDRRLGLVAVASTRATRGGRYGVRDHVDAGRIHPEVQSLVAGTYAELSPSGRGVRAFVRGDLGNRKDAHGTPFGFEVFASKGFVTVTGAALEITKLTESEDIVADASPDVLELCSKRFGHVPSEAPAPADGDVPPLGLTLDPKPTAKKTTGRSGFSIAIFTASSGE